MQLTWRTSRGFWTWLTCLLGITREELWEIFFCNPGIPEVTKLSPAMASKLKDIHVAILQALDIVEASWFPCSVAWMFGALLEDYQKDVVPIWGNLLRVPQRSVQQIVKRQILEDQCCFFKLAVEQCTIDVVPAVGRFWVCLSTIHEFSESAEGLQFPGAYIHTIPWRSWDWRCKQIGYLFRFGQFRP